METIGTHAAACGCGGREGLHLTGEPGCFREIVPAPALLREDPHPWMETWEVEGAVVTGYTLRYQRLYHRHRDDVWSRPRGGGSVNSLPDET